MNSSVVDSIANAVLYEGYMLYPYRPSATKNRQRFNFGVLAPREYCEVHSDFGASSFQTQVLLRGNSESILEIKLRFLHLVSRQVGQLLQPTDVVPNGQLPDYRLVPSLEVSGQLFQPWQEALEREQTIYCSLDQTISVPLQESFLFSGGGETEFLRGPDSTFLGFLLRSRKTLNGELSVHVSCVSPDLYKLTLRVANLSRTPQTSSEDREEVLLSSLISAHAILHITNGEFISLLEPPTELQPEVSGCQNIGVFPVLVGEQAQADTMLASPIILYDYPQVAPESPGDLFDGAEIDEILSLRIMTMTEDEKREMRQSDDRARRILERTENLPEEHLQKLHGALRGLSTTPRDDTR
jgi:hydrogenase maturation protease